MIARTFALLLIALGVVGAPEARAQAETKQDQARGSTLIERTGRRLAQLDVTVTGPDEAVAVLTREDFELVVGGRYFEDFIVDRVCREPSGGEVKEVETIRTEGTAPVPSGPSATVLFYFDQPHLTMAGWNRSLRMAREIIPELVTGGNRGMIVANTRSVLTYADLTEDADELIQAVKRMEQEKKWNPWAQQEISRVAEIQDLMGRSGADNALAAARRYQREEQWETGKALRRFSMVLGRLADLDPPKVVLYFADTMRSNAGEHYISMFPRAMDDPGRQRAETDAFMAVAPFDRVIDEAAAHGVRLYTIQAEGLRGDSSFGVGRGASGGAAAGGGLSQRIRAAENSLKSFAAETGGRAFTGGYRVRSIVTSIRDDLSCLYLVSFDPGELPEDTALPVRVRLKQPELRAQVRGRIVLQSESAALTSRLLAAFGSPDAVRDEEAIHADLIPTGYSDGRFHALLQISVNGSPVSGAVWDVGATVLSGDKLLDDTSGRINVSGPGVPVVLEKESSFKPGPYSVVSVAHESNSDQTTSRETRGQWPNPKDSPASVTPISIVQPADAAFVRNGEVRSAGALAVSAGAPVRADLPTAFVGMVCWDGLQKTTLDVERSLVGDSSAEFPPMSVEPNEDRCAYFRDLVGPKTMTPGNFSYRVRVSSADAELVVAERSFSAALPATAPPDPAPASGVGG